MGIGRALADGLAAEGANIVIADQTGAEAAAAEMTEAGFTALGVACDVSSEEETMNIAARTIEAFGSIDVLVNNVGAARNADILELATEQIDEALRLKSYSYLILQMKLFFIPLEGLVMKLPFYTGFLHVLLELTICPIVPICVMSQAA